MVLIGLQMTNEEKLLKIEASTTISEVERRTRDLVSELQKRHIAKSLSEKVREKTGM